MTTSTVEDYVETIYKLILEKGYARAIDIAEHLAVHPSSVTRMIQKLDEFGYANYEKYRGLLLTSKGEQLAAVTMERSNVLADLLKMIGMDEKTSTAEAKHMGRHIGGETFLRLSNMLQFFNEHPHISEALKQFLFHNQIDEDT